MTKLAELQAAAPKIAMILLERYHSASNYQRHAMGKGTAFNITYEQFVELWPSTYIAAIRRQLVKVKATKNQELRAEKMKAFFKHPDLGFVLTWIDGKEKDEMNIHNSAILRRRQSLKNARFKKGDKHSDESKELIRQARIGKTHTEATKERISAKQKGKTFDDAHKQRISDSLKGQSKSPIAKEKMRIAALARQARKREDASNLRDQVNGMFGGAV